MNLIEVSKAVIKQNQDVSGAYVASPSFDNYKYCWLRDGTFIAYAMDRAGEHESARRFHDWVLHTALRHKAKVDHLKEKMRNGVRPEAEDFLPCRYSVTGTEMKDGWPNFQMDGYGTWLWGVMEHLRMTGDWNRLAYYRPGIDLVSEYLAQFWQLPNSDCWEENPDRIHPSTLACIYGGLMSVGAQVDVRYEQVARTVREYVLADGVSDGRFVKSIGSRSIDASLLWLSIPFRLVTPDHPYMVKTVAEIEGRLLHGGGVHRFPEDTYYGGGHWLLLSCWLGWYYKEMGRLEEARQQLHWVESQADSDGLMPEQTLEHVNDPSFVMYWVKRWGPVAKPLLWSHAMHLVLSEELVDASGS